MDMLLPLVVAAWRCKLVRDAAVIFLGLVLLLLGQHLSRDSSEWLDDFHARNSHILIVQMQAEW